MIVILSVEAFDEMEKQLTPLTRFNNPRLTEKHFENLATLDQVTFVIDPKVKDIVNSKNIIIDLSKFKGD